MNSLGKFNKLNKNEQLLRMKLLKYEVDNFGPISMDVVEKFMREDDYFSNITVEELMENLTSQSYMRTNKENKICYIYPISCEKTDYRVTLSDGKSFYAMCAIDAMGAVVTFHEPVIIDSVSKDTGEKIRVEVDKKGIVNASPDRDFFVSYYDTFGEVKDFNC